MVVTFALHKKIGVGVASPRSLEWCCLPSLAGAAPVGWCCSLALSCGWCCFLFSLLSCGAASHSLLGAVLPFSFFELEIELNVTSSSAPNYRKVRQVKVKWWLPWSSFHGGGCCFASFLWVGLLLPTLLRLGGAAWPPAGGGAFSLSLVGGAAVLIFQIFEMTLIFNTTTLI